MVVTFAQIRLCNCVNKYTSAQSDMCQQRTGLVWCDSFMIKSATLAWKTCNNVIMSSDQALLKWAISATDLDYHIIIVSVTCTACILITRQTNKAHIRLHICASWCTPLLFACKKVRLPTDRVSYKWLSYGYLLQLWIIDNGLNILSFYGFDKVVKIISNPPATINVCQ